MRKILVCDHQFNVESISCCSQQYTDTIFYTLNSQLSFYDNFDIINPDIVWVNDNFFDLSNYKIQDIKIINYNIPYIIPNKFADLNQKNDEIISCILFDSNNLIIDKIYEYENSYVRFYSIATNDLYHIQNCGKIETCKDLTNIIVSSNRVLFDNPIIKNMCSFYNKLYGTFKPKGTISWTNSVLPTISNLELFNQNEK